MRATVALTAITIGLISCGGDEPPKDASEPAARTPGAAKAVATAGEIGEATTAAPELGTRRLSSGGRPNPAAPRRPRGGVGVGVGAQCDQVDLDPVQANLAAISATTVCLVNAERSARGLGALRPNANLETAAAGHAADMVRRRYFAHESPDGGNVVARVKATGYLRGIEEWTVGENLAWGTGPLARPQSIVNAWMNSPGHRDNILRPAYDEIGAAIVVGNPNGPEGATFVHAFGAAEPGEAEPELRTEEAEPPDAVPAAESAKARRRLRAAARRRCARRNTAASRSRCRARALRRR